MLVTPKLVVCFVVFFLMCIHRLFSVFVSVLVHLPPKLLLIVLTHILQMEKFQIRYTVAMFAWEVSDPEKSYCILFSILCYIALLDSQIIEQKQWRRLIELFPLMFNSWLLISALELLLFYFVRKHKSCTAETFRWMTVLVQVLFSATRLFSRT